MRYRAVSSDELLEKPPSIEARIPAKSLRFKKWMSGFWEFNLKISGRRWNGKVLNRLDRGLEAVGTYDDCSET